MQVPAGSTVIVTGGASGIGAGVCELLAARGCAVTLADRSRELASEVADRIISAGGKAEAQFLDVADPDAIDAFFSSLAANGTKPWALRPTSTLLPRAGPVLLQ